MKGEVRESKIDPLEGFIADTYCCTSFQRVKADENSLSFEWITS